MITSGTCPPTIGINFASSIQWNLEMRTLLGLGQNIQYIGVSTFQGFEEFIAMVLILNNGENAVSLLPYSFNLRPTYSKQNLQ